MSSSRRADLTALPGRLLAPRTWTLRTRLLAAQVALLAFVCVGIGAGTQLALDRFLMHQLDEQVVEAGHRSAGIYELGPPPLRLQRVRPPPQPNRPPGPGPVRLPGPGPDFLDAPGQAVGTVGAVVVRSRLVDSGIVTSGGTSGELPAAASRQLAQLTAARTPVTVELEGLGSYRLVANHTRAGAVVVTGLPTDGVQSTLTTTLLIFSLISAVALAAAVVAGILIIRRQLAPLATVSAAATDVANLELDRGEVRLPTPIVKVDPDAAHTELGQLGAALNQMLDRIAGALQARHASETRVRQFVADASHELRTPLAAIAGYTELAQREREHVPAEVAHAMSRVESEARRMTQLVEDMLLLARLDAGRPLESRPVDLSRLAVDAVSDAHVAAPDHEWSLDVPDEPVTLTGDAARLQQVLANLLANCRVHTPAGTTVVTSLARDGAGVTLRVVDDGPGIPADQQSEIFERFVRGDSSRSRRGGSTGLGLAIVAAVVKAHRGTIEVESHPGATEFRVHLPV